MSSSICSSQATFLRTALLSFDTNTHVRVHSYVVFADSGHSDICDAQHRTSNISVFIIYGSSWMLSGAERTGPVISSAPADPSALDVTNVGRCSVFEVRPSQLSEFQRLFLNIIWICMQTLLALPYPAPFPFHPTRTFVEPKSTRIGTNLSNA